MSDSRTLHDPSELRRRRIEAGLNQIDLAGKTGLHQSYISLLERGRKSPTAKTLKVIADALPECTVADLLRGRPKVRRRPSVKAAA